LKFHVYARHRFVRSVFRGLSWSLLVFGALSGALGAGCVQAAAPQACQMPQSGDAAALGLRELHEFGKNYEVRHRRGG
jgi:hypothetical protein